MNKNIAKATHPTIHQKLNSHLKRKISQIIRITIPSIQTRLGYSLLSSIMLLANPTQNMIIDHEINLI